MQERSETPPEILCFDSLDEFVQGLLGRTDFHQNGPEDCGLFRVGFPFGSKRGIERADLFQWQQLDDFILILKIRGGVHTKENFFEFPS